MPTNDGTLPQFWLLFLVFFLLTKLFSETSKKKFRWFRETTAAQFRLFRKTKTCKTGEIFAEQVFGLFHSFAKQKYLEIKLLSRLAYAARSQRECCDRL
jgi:hypothetical protein